MRGRLGCAAVVAYPIVEISLAVIVAQRIGWWWVLVFVVVCIAVGLGLVRYALEASGRSFGLAMSELSSPDQHAEVLVLEGAVPEQRVPPAQTLLIVPAGLLIAVPGFMTTLIGLIMWTPPVRKAIAERIGRAARGWGPPGQGA